MLASCCSLQLLLNGGSGDLSIVAKLHSMSRQLLCPESRGRAWQSDALILVRSRALLLQPSFDQARKHKVCGSRSKSTELGFVYGRPSGYTRCCHTVVAKEGVRASERESGRCYAQWFCEGLKWLQMLFWACAKQFSNQFEAFSACWVWNL